MKRILTLALLLALCSGVALADKKEKKPKKDNAVEKAIKDGKKKDKDKKPKKDKHEHPNNYGCPGHDDHGEGHGKGKKH